MMAPLGHCLTSSSEQVCLHKQAFTVLICSYDLAEFVDRIDDFNDLATAAATQWVYACMAHSQRAVQQCRRLLSCMGSLQGNPSIYWLHCMYTQPV